MAIIILFLSYFYINLLIINHFTFLYNFNFILIIHLLFLSLFFIIYPKIDLFRLIGFYILTIPLALFKYYILLIPLFLVITLILKSIDEKNPIYLLFFTILYLFTINLIKLFI
jgi:hypothetical protein